MAILALAVLLAPASADAQLSKLRRALEKRVQEQLAGANGASPAASGRPVFGDAVLEMTPEVLDRFGKALAAERADLAEVAGRIGPEATQAYEECAAAVTAGEALRKLTLEHYEGLGDRPQAEMAAVQAEYERRASRMIEAERGPMVATEGRRALEDRPTRTGGAAGGFTARQYAVLKERAPVFCELLPEAGGRWARVPVRGRNDFHVFSAAEVEALRPRCTELQPLLEAVL